MKFFNILASTAIVIGLPATAHNQYNGYNGEINTPQYHHQNSESGQGDGLFTSERDCLNNDQLRLFGIKFDLLPGVAYTHGIDINRGCGSLFNVHAINDVIKKAGDTIGRFIHPFSHGRKDY